MARQIEKVAVPVMHITVNELSREAWTRFLLEEPQAHPWHTWEWGDYIAQFRRRRVTRLAVWSNQDDLIGLFSMTLQHAFPMGKVAESTPAFAYSGPILKSGLSSDERREAHRELVRFLDEESRRNRILHLTVRVWEPGLDYGCLRQWVDMGYNLRKDQSFLYLAQEDESATMKRYDHDFRNQVRQGFRRGGTVEINASVDARSVYVLYLKSMAHAGAEPYAYFNEVASALNRNEDGFRDVYVCKYAGKLIGFAICLKFNRTALYWLAGMDRKYSEIRPANMIIDEFIRNSRSQGIQRIDFGGAPDRSLFDFKLSIGAKPVSVFILKKTFNRLGHLHVLAKDIAGYVAPRSWTLRRNTLPIVA